MSTRINFLPFSLAALIVLAAPALLGAGCFPQPAVQGSGTQATEERQVEAFDSIELRGSPQVVVNIDPAADAPGLSVTTDDNLLEFVETSVRGAALVVEARDNLSPTQGIQVQITVPALSAVRVIGSGTVQVAGMEGRAFSARVTGSGTVQLAGSATRLDLNVIGSGSIAARDVEAADAAAAVTGSGNISLRASGLAEASITGSGDIMIHGQPQQISTTVTGSGRVRTQTADQ